MDLDWHDDNFAQESLRSVSLLSLEFSEFVQEHRSKADVYAH